MAAMKLHYQTVDVFTETRFGGNQLAVVLDADGLSRGQMQTIAREFNYSETAFVSKPANPKHDAKVRIFTPTVEVPFAGHPNVGTAFVMTSLDTRWRRASKLVFEEAAGLVVVDIQRKGEGVSGVQITAPQALSSGRTFDITAIAKCLGLAPQEICRQRHEPIVASVGLPFVVVELTTRDALSRATPVTAEFDRLLPADGADAIYLYSKALAPSDGDVDLTARMFAPSDGLAEDPATGSATGAACALLASVTVGKSDSVNFRVAQGVDMGRPSRLYITVDRSVSPPQTYISGACVAVMSGVIDL